MALCLRDVKSGLVLRGSSLDLASGVFTIIILKDAMITIVGTIIKVIIHHFSCDK